jgi:hypothetical protein
VNEHDRHAGAVILEFELNSPDVRQLQRRSSGRTAPGRISNAARGPRLIHGAVIAQGGRYCSRSSNPAMAR